MSGRVMRISRAPARALALIIIIAASPLLPFGMAQGQGESLLQIEVSDSIGLPLPDAKVEVFTFLEGGVFWEWAPIGDEELPAGITLLRFSYPGYQSSTFSVPIRTGSKISLRVRLMSERDTTKRGQVVEAREVHAIGLALEGRMKTDIIGRRRIVERDSFDADDTQRFGVLMRRVRNTELTVIPASGGSYRIMSQAMSGRSNCPLLVMINGDRRRVFTFTTFDQLYGTHDLEALEVFPRGGSIPNSYQVPGSGCGLMVAWFRAL